MRHRYLRQICHFVDLSFFSSKWIQKGGSIVSKLFTVPRLVLDGETFKRRATRCGSTKDSVHNGQPEATYSPRNLGHVCFWLSLNPLIKRDTFARCQMYRMFLFLGFSDLFPKSRESYAQAVCAGLLQGHGGQNIRDESSA